MTCGGQGQFLRLILMATRPISLVGINHMFCQISCPLLTVLVIDTLLEKYERYTSNDTYKVSSDFDILESVSQNPALCRVYLYFSSLARYHKS